VSAYELEHRPAVNVYVHPMYDSAKRVNDVSLIKVKRAGKRVVECTNVREPAEKRNADRLKYRIVLCRKNTGIVCVWSAYRPVV